MHQPVFSMVYLFKVWVFELSQLLKQSFEDKTKWGKSNRKTKENKPTLLSLITVIFEKIQTFQAPYSGCIFFSFLFP